MKTRYNPERRAWRGKSYRKGGRRVRALRDGAALREGRTAIAQALSE